MFSTAHHLKFTSFEKNMHKYNNIHIFTHKFVQRSILVLTYKHTKYAQYKTVVRFRYELLLTEVNYFRSMKIVYT